MRISLYIRPDLSEKLKQLAWEEHRHPRQQAEFLLQQAIERVVPATTPQSAEQQGDTHAQR